MLTYALLLFGTLSAHASSLPVEIVQSVPIETNLAVPGIRTTQQVWLEMINGAQHSIDIEQFYIDSQPGQALEPVLNALQTAANRGVLVRVLIDSQFYKTYPNDPNQLSQINNVEVRTVDFSSLGGVQHAKYMVVDGQQALVGSANFDWLALTHIHEIGLHFADTQLTAGVEAIFGKDWLAGTSVGNHGAGAPLLFYHPANVIHDLPGFQLVASPTSDMPAGVSDTLPALLNLIKSARTRIQVQNYEYNTSVYKSSTKWKVLDSALRAAAARGVEVQLLVDHTALKAGKADLAALRNLSGFQVKVVTVPQWSGGAIPFARLIHSKYMIVDGNQAWVGSEDWSETYFTECRNVGLIFNEPQTVSALGQVFNQVWNSPYITN